MGGELQAAVEAVEALEEEIETPSEWLMMSHFIMLTRNKKKIVETGLCPHNFKFVLSFTGESSAKAGYPRRVFMLYREYLKMVHSQDAIRSLFHNPNVTELLVGGLRFEKASLSIHWVERTQECIKIFRDKGDGSYILIQESTFMYFCSQKDVIKYRFDLSETARNYLRRLFEDAVENTVQVIRAENHSYDSLCTMPHSQLESTIIDALRQALDFPCFVGSQQRAFEYDFFCTFEKLVMKVNMECHSYMVTRIMEEMKELR